MKAPAKAPQKTETRGVIIDGRPYLIEDQWPSPIREGITVFRLRALNRQGKPGKHVITRTGRITPGKANGGKGKDPDAGQ